MRVEIHPADFRHKSFDDEDDSSSHHSEPVNPRKPKTEWHKVYVGALLIFLANLEKNVLALADWLYMKQLDPEVNPDYFGAVLGVARIGHAVATIGFSYWRSETKTTKNGLLLGRVCDLVALILYCGVEFFGSWKRYVLMTVYFLVYRSIINLRTYIVDCSIPEDRSSAFALRTLANVAAMLLAPVMQLFFASIEYPGITLGHESLRLHLFSGPLLVTLATNVFATVLIIFCYSEPASLGPTKVKESKPEMRMTSSETALRSVPSYSMTSRLWGFITKPNFSWHLISVICLAKVAVYASNSTILVVHAPYCQVGFGWSSAETVVELTNAKIYVGIVSVAITIFFFKMGKRIGDNWVLLVCAVLGLAYYVVTYPIPGLLSHSTTPLYNETTRGGCNETEYAWCGAPVGNPAVWVYSSVIMLVIVVQIALVASDAVFSNLLEKIDQSMMQGLLVVLSDAVQTFASMYSADLFTRFGLGPLWILNLVLAAGVLVISLLYFRRFR
ncbi:unnamed protein product, partial [Mesorhabditis spiculigera]